MEIRTKQSQKFYEWNTIRINVVVVCRRSTECVDEVESGERPVNSAHALVFCGAVFVIVLWNGCIPLNESNVF